MSIPDPSGERRGLGRRQFLQGLLAGTLCHCGRIDATSWVTRGPYDVERRFVESMETLLPPPAPSPSRPDRWSMLVVSDLHCCHGAPEILARVQAYLEWNPVDFIFQLGDLADGGWSVEHEDGFGALQRLGLPVYGALGNHDLFHQGWETFRELWGPSVYELSCGPSLLLVLDTAGATLGVRQRRWLEDRLADTQATHVIVLTHYPLWVTGYGGTGQLASQQEVYDLLHLFRQYPVRAHISGHTHRWQAARVEGVRLVTVSALAESGFDPRGLRVEVAGDELTFTAVPFRELGGVQS